MSSKIGDSIADYVDGADGFPASAIFLGSGNHATLTYDDVIMMPGQIDFGLADVDIGSRITKKIKLHVPFVSSPMDTVTEDRMAIALALQGGIGIIHYNNSIEEQAQLVRNVKSFENGFISNPLVLAPATTLQEVDERTQVHGFSSFPITVDGKMGSKLVGIISSRDTDFVADREATTVADVMTTDLVTALEGCTLEQANASMRESKKVSFNGNIYDFMLL
jgi:IMP dehydrogenase|tara:strand:- start:536 stop:1198 length:663 start_codon:yes stop_codon:yes gene_type:complete